MRLLLDQCTPLGLVRLLVGHDAVRAAWLGWEELTNGNLLAAAEVAGFDALVTSDQNIGYQQNLAERRIAIIVLSTNNWTVLRSSAARIIQALETAGEGSYQVLEFPRPPLRRRPPPRRP